MSNLKVIDSIDSILSSGGGLPQGILIELFGSEGSGKTSFSTLACANAQKAGLKVGYIDTEYAYDVNHAKNLGVNIDELAFQQPESAEEALQLIKDWCKEGYGLIIVDSVAGLVPQAIIDGNGGLAELARLLALNLPAIAREAKISGAIIIFINQIRDKISTFFNFGDRTSTCGGHALKHFASIRLQLNRVAWLKYGVKVIGFKTRVRAVKNKKAPPYQDAFFQIVFDFSIDEKIRNKKLGISEVKDD